VTSFADATADFPIFGLPAATSTQIPNTPGFIQRHLNAASEFAASCILARSPTLPLAPYPEEIVQRVCEIAAYRILCVVGYKPASEFDTAVKDRHDAAETYFTDIREGRLTPTWLPLSSLAEASSDAPRGWYDETTANRGRLII
jgi:hypothetical protein